MAEENWTIDVDQNSDGEVTFSVDIPQEDVESERKQAINELKQEVEVSGFRKGKVPDSIIEKQRPQQVRQALLERLVPRACGQVYEEHDLRPIKNPEIEDFNFDDGFHMEATVLVQPSVDVSGEEYKNFELTAESQEVSEEEVEEQLDQMRSQQASLEPVPIARPVEEGDFVKIDFQAYDQQGNPMEGTAADDQVIEVGSERFLPDIEDGIVGASEGENRRIQATFPEDFVDDNLAGSTLDFDVTVKEIQEEQKPDLDSEEFLEEMDVDSPEDLREQVRERLSEADEQKRREELSEQIYENLLEEYDIAIPEPLIDDEVDKIIEDYRRQVEQQERDFDEFLREQDKDLEELREESRPQAERRIKLTLLFQAIAEHEDVEVTEEDFEEHLQDLAEQTGMDPSQIGELPDEQKQSLRFQLRDDKVLDFLIEEANVEEVESTESDEASEAEPAEAAE
ncbi:MAG: trigger factor [bacterium]